MQQKAPEDEESAKNEELPAEIYKRKTSTDQEGIKDEEEGDEDENFYEEIKESQSDRNSSKRSDKSNNRKNDSPTI